MSDKFVPRAENAKNQNMFEKIISKLLEFNERINSGKEISLVEYLKEIDMKSEFIRKFEN